MILNMFTIPVDVNNNINDIETIREYCLSYKSKNISRLKSNVNGWQSNDLQGTHMPLNNLFKLIEKKSNKFAKQIGLKEVRLDNIWININNKNSSNKEHTHPNSVLSGVYYVNCNEESGDIYFVHPSAATMQYDWQDKSIYDFNNITGANRNIRPNTGDLLIFPSWLSHGVHPNNSENFERISISFNMRIK